MKTSLVGFSILFTCSLMYESVLPAQSGSFGQAQQTYVPTSLIPRRYDSDPVGETDWAATSGASSPLVGGVSPQSIINAINNAQTQAQLSAACLKGKKALSKLIDKGKWDDAEVLGRKLVQADPKDQELKDMLTRILVAEARRAYNKPDLDTAQLKARQALSFEPASEPAKLVLKETFTKKGRNFQSAKEHLKVADALAVQGKFVEGNVEYRLALEIKPSAAAHIGMGNTAVGQGLFDKASKEYQAALQIDPKSGAAYRQLGCLKLAFRDLAGANQDLSKAITLNQHDESAKTALTELWQQQVTANPNAVNGHLGLARAFLLSGNLESAREEYRQVARMDPNNPQLPAARVAFKQALAKSEGQKCLEAARTLTAHGALLDAQAKLAEALNYTPTSPDVLLLNGEVFEKRGLMGQAHDAYMAVLKADPTNVIAAQRLKALATSSATTKASNSDVLPLLAPLRGNLNGKSNPVTAVNVPVSANPANAPPLAPPINSNAQQAPLINSNTQQAPPTSSTGQQSAASQSLLAPPQSSANAIPVTNSETNMGTNPVASPAASPGVTPALSTDSIPVAPQTSPTFDQSTSPSSSQGSNSEALTTSTMTPAVQPATTGGAGIVPVSAPAGAQTMSHVSKLGSFLGSLRNLTTGNQQQSVQGPLQSPYVVQPQSPYAVQLQSPYGLQPQSPYTVQLQSPYGLQPQSPYTVQLQSPYGPQLQSQYANGAPSYVMASPSAPAAPASQSLLSAMTAPITNKLGLPALGANNSQPNPVMMTSVTMPQYVANPNGGYYMVPVSVPVVVANSQNSQPNPLWSQLANSKVGQKFHMAQASQSVSGVGSFLSQTPAPSFMQQQQQQQNQMQINNLVAANAAMTGTQTVSAQVLNPRADQIPQSAPQIQIKDWNTANSEPDEVEQAPAANTSNDAGQSGSLPSVSPSQPVPASINPGANQSSNGAASEVGLKPDILAVSLEESLRRPVSLKVSAVNETASGAKVTVILENNGTKELKIPNNQKIALRVGSKEEQLLVIKFKTHSVPAGGTATGTVAVPVHQLDSSSDLYLPKFLQDGVKLTDLHAQATI
jgi:tetratricopeptide (TPR) repeat protein